ncbi:nucleoside recognition GATE domain-containing membrane protein YjiH [Tindallia magadiensis]|uniref:Nucleoside recognition GATE domain-containing membrane protein YjiH n=1 Tax=Tindallia magadiensis TaxID=69895 RepID=A0A1I3H3R7_9FIRM|nr:YjiH family protein [Tindallia magadiensis]SFI30339.1 nucleoside recognition GATE domain-containing membrane protein YjiH [Tindallia magadiensis]
MSSQKQWEKNQQQKIFTTQNVLKFLFFSTIGIFMFFIPITFNERTSIPLDHIVSEIRANLASYAQVYALIVILLGSIYPFYKKSWSSSPVNTVLSLLKVFGVIVAGMVYFSVGPTWILDPDIGPFLFNALVIPVGLIVPIGSVFLAFIVGYGLLEFIGVIMRPVMKPIFKTPGRSAIDAVASFVGSYSLGLVITNRVYKEGKYSAKEASIIATGFSTVSATFMIIVGRTLGLMEMWNLYFWTTLIITFIVTAITVRIWPLNKKEDAYYEDSASLEKEYKDQLIKNAWREGLTATYQSKSFISNVSENLRDGFVMAMGILPSIMSVGLIGLLLAEYTPIFNLIGYIFYPFTALLQIPDPMLAATAISMSIAEMFLPALMVTEAALATRFVVGIVSISSILFFSASIPCILSTDIPISVTEMVIIWVQRCIITIIIAAPIAMILF